MQKKLVIIGHGKMGRAVEQIARDSGWEITGVFDQGWDGSAAMEVLKSSAVAIEFTEPAAAMNNLRAVVEAGCPVVVGTTGWYQQLGDVESLVRQKDGKLFWSPNFSPGAQIMMKLAESAAALVRTAGSFEAQIVETHHSAKKDVPSGTAAALERAAAPAFGKQIPVASVRVGSVPGTHQLIFDAAFEQIRITHDVRDRRVFAAGALLAAEWLANQTKSGVYTMSDLFGGTESKK